MSESFIQKTKTPQVQISAYKYNKTKYSYIDTNNSCDSSYSSVEYL